MYYDIQAVSNRIRELRIAKGFTQEQLCERIGVDRSYLSRVERGKQGCSMDIYIRMMEVFQVTLDYLVLGVSGPAEAVISPQERAHMKRLLDSAIDQIKEV